MAKSTAQVAWGPSDVKSHLPSTEGPENREDGSSLAQQLGKSDPGQPGEEEREGGRGEAALLGGI